MITGKTFSTLFVTLFSVIFSCQLCAAESPAALDAAAQAALEGKTTKSYRIGLQAEPLWAALPRPERVVLEKTQRAGAPLVLRVNCGMEMGDAGWRYRDEQGRVWLPDRPWIEGAKWGVKGGGHTLRTEKDLELPEGHPAPGLYRAERYAPEEYVFALPEGRYTLRLHFQENYQLDQAAPGRRVFDVLVNGAVVREKFDPVAAAGGKARTPVIEELADVQHVEGLLRISFQTQSGEPAMINGIEILGQEPLTQDFVMETGEIWRSPEVPEIPEEPGEIVGRYLCGVGGHAAPGYELHTADGAAWWPDGPGAPVRYGFWAEGGGAGRFHDPIHFLHTATPQIYRYHRFGGEGFQFKVPENAKYAVRLHFAEGSETGMAGGVRVFDVLLEDQIVLENFTPLKAAGGFALPAVFEARGVTVEDGQLSLSVVEHDNSWAISAVEIFRDPEGPEELQVRQVQGPAERQPLEPVSGEDALRVLFVGNSHTFFWNMPQTVAAGVNSQPGSTVALQPYFFLHGGRTLDFFSETAKRGGERPSVFEVMRAGKYDAVVLQIFSVKSFESLRKMLQAVRDFAEVAQETDTRIVLYCYHPLSIMDGFTLQTFHRLVEEHGITVIPFGDVHQAFLKQLSQTDMRFDRQGVGPHLGFHPAYLNTCAHIIAWTGQSPVGHPFPTLMAQDCWVDPPQARFLQEIAWDAWQRTAEEHSLKPFAQ